MIIKQRRKLVRPPLDSTSAFPSGGSKVIRGIIARKEGEPGNEAIYYSTVLVKTFFTFSLLFFLAPASRELQSRLKSKYRVERVKTPSKSGE